MSIEDQNAVVGAPLVDMSVVAGAGSGKTKTAIGRVLATLERIPTHCKVALLSFSNVAVNTFRQGLGAQKADTGRVTVATFDSFFTQYVLLPYAASVMQSAEKPYLVLGEEPFLAAFSILHGGRTHPISDLKIHMGAQGPQALFGNQQIPWHIAEAAIVRLGRTGAYTYDTGRYWTYRTLLALPFLVQLLVCRYPQMLIDEAQDIGSMDWAVLGILRANGIQVAMIGDPAQAIFGFNGGDGAYLRSYIQMQEVQHFSLRTNFRSVPAIVACANSLTGRNDAAARMALPTHSGAFIVPYDPADPRQVLNHFQGVLHPLGYAADEIAVICRANALVAHVRGGTLNRGAGLVKKFVKAVDHRLANEYHLAYKECVGVIGALLDPLMPRFREFVDEPNTALSRAVKSRIWLFTCDHDNGLPHSQLNARSVWKPLLVRNLRILIGDLAALGFTFGDISQKITTRDLEDSPLVEPRHAVRVETVHQVKGESIGAVLYIASEQHAASLLGGAVTENGRIGYVALTRARDVFWLAVPANSYAQLLPRAAAVGIRPL